MVDESVINVVKQYLENVASQGIPIYQGIIFGSQIQGEQLDQWSDIDLLVISPRFDNDIDRKDINLLWHIAARTDSRIEPIPVGAQRFAKDDSSAIIEIARREGQVVRLKE